MTSRPSRAPRVPGARHWPLAALLLGSVLWGGAITGTKYALRAFDPVTLLSVELAAATAALWAALLIRATGRRRPGLPRRARRADRRGRPAPAAGDLCIVETPIHDAHAPETEKPHAAACASRHADWLSRPEASALRLADRLPRARMRRTPAPRDPGQPPQRFDGHCSTLTGASWVGEILGRPSRGYHPAKSSSAHRPSSRSRTRIAVVPAGCCPAPPARSAPGP